VCCTIIDAQYSSTAVRNNHPYLKFCGGHDGRIPVAGLPELCDAHDKTGGFGTHSDGSQHDEYCTYCMQKGEFTALDLTIKDMADSNPNMMIKEFNMPEDQAKAAAMDGLVGFKRWQ